MTRKEKMYAGITGLVAILVGFVFYFYSYAGSRAVYEGYTSLTLDQSKVENIVTSIYLDFRLFDTIFEALLLLLSIGAIFIFTSLTEDENQVSLPSFDHDPNDVFQLPRIMMSVVYPLLFMLGIYMIVNGADSPGGGFQAGAILASIMMSRYIVDQVYDYDYYKPYTYEKIIYIFILIFSVYHLMGWIPRDYLRDFVLLMNILLAVKVMLGFSAIFIKFMNGDDHE